MNRLITFQSVHQAMKAERVLLQAGVKVKFRPTPRELSVSCGQSMLFDNADEVVIMAAFFTETVTWSNMFAITETEGANKYAKLGSYADYQLARFHSV
ncbi:MAG: DUF3343 domain-containing protein [Negativicutes bacterium]|jgi:hypothetical protein